MKIEVALTPDLIRSGEVGKKTIAVVDVLRATTSMVAALANGALRIYPFETMDALEVATSRFNRGEILKCGERGGRRITGFDLGNSPEEYGSNESIRNKTLLFTTTNGTRALLTAQRGEEVVTAGFVNIGAVVRRLIRDERDCLIICAGNKGGFSLEDTVCAGMIVKRVEDQHAGAPVIMDDTAQASRILYEHYGSDLSKMLKDSAHGQYLKRIGMDRDIPACIDVDRYDTVPVYREGALVI